MNFKLSWSIWILYFILIGFGIFFSLGFHEGNFVMNEKYYMSFYFEVLLYRLLISTGIGINVILATLVTQRLVSNELASPSLLGIQQMNFIVYVGVFVINKPLFERIFNSNDWENVLLELFLYVSASFLVAYFIIWFAKYLNANYIIMVGIIINVILTAITLFILKKVNAPNDDFNKIYAKMMGAFFTIRELMGKQVNSTLLMCIVSNVFGIVGTIWYKMTYWRTEKNLNIIGSFGISHKQKYWTRIQLILIISIASSLTFILAGGLTFVGIAILMFVRIFISRSYQMTNHAIFSGMIMLIYTVQIAENFIKPNIGTSIPSGVYVSSISLIIIIVVFLKRSIYVWIKSK